MAGERSDLGKIFITDGGIYDANTTYEKLTMVSYNNSTYITLRTVTGVTPSNDRINYGLMAQGFTATYLSSVTAEDVQGLVVEAGSETPAQSLINAIADRVANQLVSNSDLQDILSDYILKSAIANNLSITEEGKVLDARQGKALNDALVNTTIQSYTPELVRTNGSTVIGQDTTSASKVGKYVKIGNKVFVFASIKTRITESGEYPCITLPYHAVNSNMPFTVAELTQNFQSTAAHISTANVSSSLSVASIRNAEGTSAVKTSTMASGTSAYITFSGWYLTDQ